MGREATSNELTRAIETWERGVAEVSDVVEHERCLALASLLDREAPGVGQPLPLLWHVIVGNPPLELSRLGGDGHPSDSPLQPPIRNRRRLFGGSTVRIEAPLNVGDHVVHRAHIGDAAVKQGTAGPIAVVTEVHDWMVGGELRVRESRRIVYRSGDVVQSRGAAAREAQDPPHGEGRRVTLDERGLFIFSCLTANAHRIHYDRRYATRVEGHEDLLVHGPLLGILLAGQLEEPRGELVGELDYRLKAPVPVGTELRLHAGPGADGTIAVAGTCRGVEFGALTSRIG